MKIKIKLKRRDILLSISIFILLEILLTSIYYNFIFKPGVKLSLDYRLKDEIKVNNTFLNSYRTFSKSLFNNVINKKSILKIVYDYDHASPEEKDLYRKRLYDSLKFVYNVIKYKNFSIFHFHGPDGRSILRFHKPGKYGDNLLPFRKSIGIIRKQHKYIEGFEEGRIVNSYRFIYPLFYNGDYIGSVELSVSLTDMLQEDEELYIGVARFLLKEKLFEEIVNKYTEKYYSSSEFEGYKTYNFYLKNKKYNHQIADSVVHILNKKVKKQLADNPVNNKPAIKWVKYKGKNYLLTFMPVLNISGQQAAMIVYYEHYKPINSLIKSLNIAITIATIFSFLISILIMFFNWGRKQAIEQRKRIYKAKERAEEMARLKSSFLANMSHEIRTPMNGVIGMTEILKQTKLSKEQKDFVTIIESSASSLLNVINDILDFSKIESNKIEIESISFQVRKVIEDVGDTLILHVEEKGISLLTYVDPRIPDVVIGDPARLKQVLLNLANNAVKFTYEGEVVISAELVEPESGNDTQNKPKTVSILFKVKDTGIGISKESKRKLFEPFIQADSSISRKYGGTGLGLTISKRFVELMGGKLDLDSEVGKGSVFYFQLDFEVGDSVVKDYFSSAEDLSRLRVMVLDDNESNRIIFRKYFSYWGINCDEAENVDIAIDKVKKAIDNHTPYNLVIVDFQMPGKTGFDFADIMRNEKLKRNTKLILFSSISDMIDIKNIKKHGFDSYLYKPVKYNPFKKIVYETINKDVETKLKKTGIKEEKDKIELSEDEAKYKIKILLAEDNLINQKVASVTLEKMGFKNVDIANNGTEAVQMHLDNHYDIILMDIQMPVMNGMEATNKIREYERSNPDVKRVKIIALTANALERDVKMYLSKGLDSVLTKPFKPNDLKKILFSEHNG